jgi:Laminin G domain
VICPHLVWAETLCPCKAALGCAVWSCEVEMLSLRGPGFFRRRPLLAWVGLVAGIALLSNPASAAGAIVASWEMNEPPGATTMRDSSGSNLSGSIGSAVMTGAVASGATGYRWTAQNKDGHHPERLVTVQSSMLNPGTDSFAVTIRMYTGAGHQNIIQKGQARTVGGMFKIDMVKGRVICMYRGSLGRSAIQSTQTVWDNRWHTVRCERRPDRVTLTIDGGSPRSNFGATGKIANTWPLSIGGKWQCDPPTVECDYYVGRLDRVVVERF